MRWRLRWDVSAPSSHLQLPLLHFSVLNFNSFNLSETVFPEKMIYLGVLMSIVCSVYVCDECAARHVYLALRRNEVRHQSSAPLVPLICPIVPLIRP